MERLNKIERVPAPLLIPEFGPLSGMRILTTGSIIAGPFVGTILAEYGAEVIHVERPNVGDNLRGQPPIVERDGKETSAAWIQDGRNRLSHTLEVNFNIPESKEIFLGLIKNCDVWIENMVWLDKLGINDELLLAVNPKLVIAHVSGFGRPQFGGVPEECDRPSYDPIGQAEAGYMYLNGFPEPMPPILARTMICDYVTALFCTFGVLAAYTYAQKTGKGQSIDVTQIEAMGRCLNDVFTQYFSLGNISERVGSKAPIFQPANLFKTKDNKYVYIGAYGPVVFYRFIKALGLDPDKYTMETAGVSYEAVNSELGRELDRLTIEWVTSRTAEEAKQHMQKYKVACGIVKNVADLAASDHYHKRGNFIEYLDHSLEETVKAFGFCPKMSETPPQIWRGSPKLGQDTDVILNKLLGYSDKEILLFREKGVI